MKGRGIRKLSLYDRYYRLMSGYNDKWRTAQELLDLLDKIEKNKPNPEYRIVVSDSTKGYVYANPDN